MTNKVTLNEDNSDDDILYSIRNLFTNENRVWCKTF
jgi:hypothetical protein